MDSGPQLQQDIPELGRICQTIEIPASIGQVWEQLENPGAVARWWCACDPVDIEFEPTVGGQYRECYRGEEIQYELTGSVAAFDPYRQFAVKRLTAENFDAHDTIDFKLLEYSDRTRVVLEHVYPELEEDSGASNEYYSPRWQDSLKQLRDQTIATSD